MSHSINTNTSSCYQIILTEKAQKVKEGSQDFITFYIGKHKETAHFALSICRNENAGLYSKEWIEFADIHAQLSQLAGYFPSKSLDSLFKSRSCNNCAFLTAVLKSETVGLIQAVEGYKYRYEKIAKYAERLAYLETEWKRLAGKK